MEAEQQKAEKQEQQEGKEKGTPTTPIADEMAAKKQKAGA